MNNQLPWKADVINIPFDIPVLVKKKGAVVPFMAVRQPDYEPDMVNTILGSDMNGYGFYTELSDLEFYLEVMPRL